jgi:hypothetical protein
LETIGYGEDANEVNKETSKEGPWGLNVSPLLSCGNASLVWPELTILKEKLETGILIRNLLIFKCWQLIQNSILKPSKAKLDMTYWLSVCDICSVLHRWEHAPVKYELVFPHWVGDN